MKTNLLAGMLFIIALITGVTGCTKDSATSLNDSAAQQADVKFLKDWYIQTATKESRAARSRSVLKGGKISWEKAVYSKKDNAYLVPIKIESKKSAFPFLKINEDGSGKIASAKYMVFIPKVNSFTDQGFTAVPENFTGTLLEYDLKNNLLSANYFESGVKVKSGRQLLEAKEPKENGTARVICTEWYLDTYDANGVLISSQYLFTECTGVDDSPHTTLDGDGVIVGGENICQQAAAAFFNDGSVSTSSATNISTTFNDDTDWNLDYDWIIYSASTWGISSFEKATVHKVHYSPSISRWEFVTFQHNYLAASGVNIGGTRSFVDKGPTYNTTPTHQTVWLTIKFEVTSTPTGCSVAVPPLVLQYNANHTFYAPN